MQAAHGAGHHGAALQVAQQVAALFLGHELARLYAGEPTTLLLARVAGAVLEEEVAAIRRHHDAEHGAEEVVPLDEVGGQVRVAVDDADGPAEVLAPVVRLRAADGRVVGAEDFLQATPTLAGVVDVPEEERDDVLLVLGEEDDFLAAGRERLAVELHSAAIRELGAEEGLIQLRRQRRRRGRRDFGFGKKSHGSAGEGILSHGLNTD